MPYSASLIAFAFVKKGIDEGEPVTQMKLQKMVYFAHGYHLAKYGEPLINEIFEAWKFGPVIPGIYQSYKLFGNFPITDISLIVNHPPEEELLKLSPSARDAINYTWDVTSELEATKLSAWTHTPGSPWDSVYQANQNSIPIKNDLIKKYFNTVLFG